MPNRLSNSTSPYLLQHTHNPVDWFPWGEEALKKSRDEDKPIFLSIGYAACHWCHVMAHESFEDEETAKFMNEHFINIKVDREERPDIDGIYMQATIAMTGSGGWPMSVFLTPDLKPFYAGTYFPPTRRYNMPAFKDVLSGLSNAWKNERDEVFNTSDKVTNHLQNTNQTQNDELLTKEHLNAIANAMRDSYDWGYGGWGDAPKFPQAMALEFLLHHSAMNKTDEFQNLITHCLNAMARGGMYDVVGGGFSRYSTDNLWRVPHFEKMLYDNALLVRAYLHAWQVTKNPFYKRIVQETLDFVAREMTHPDGGFYSSLDADSEGEEGKFYVWSQDEIKNILKDDYDFFEAAYGVTAKGNWENKNILQRVLDDDSLAARFRIDLETVTAKLADSHSKLLSARDLRIRPGTDDKVLTAWNGLMLAGFAEAARVFALESGSLLPKDSQTSNSKLFDSKYYQLTTRNAEFLLSKLRPYKKLVRAWRDGKTTNEVFLEDYAALILGLLELYQTDFDNKWFVSAKELTDEMIEKFSDSNGGFFDTPNDSENLLFRPKDVQDNATPSGNALACEALIKMAEYTGEGKYRDLAEKSLSLITSFTLRYPLGFARWLSAMQNVAGNMKQVAVMGEANENQFEAMKKIIQSEYRPNIIMAVSSYPIKENSPALLNDRIMIQNQATAYVCEGFVCKQPTNEIDVLVEQLNS
ncbi:MAG: thioredoxin domain-containing protein [Anaerolineales bacterium]|nr:thioredoxin domain-containing protein [Anaerolineales bacterium]